MKLRIVSDLHSEFLTIKLPEAGEDVLIFAGDIGVNIGGMMLAKTTARDLDVPILMVAGNHELYDSGHYGTHTWESTLDNLRNAADHTDKVVKGEVTFLENTVVEYEGVRFIGATLWTDMKLFGDHPDVPFTVMRAMNDYRIIFSDETGEPLTADQSIARHGVSRQFITDTLATEFDGPTVVITHHTPSMNSVPIQYRWDRVSAGYSSRLENLIEMYQPAIWCHGHTHQSYDYKIGETRIYCNPRGYAELDPNEDFIPNLIVEV